MDASYLASCIYLSGSAYLTVHECGMMSGVGFGILKVLLDRISKGLFLANPDLAAAYFLAHLVHDQQRYTGGDDA